MEFKFPFFCIVNCGTFGGKTFLINEMLNMPKMIKNKKNKKVSLKQFFKNNIFVFSPSEKLDKQYIANGIKEENIFDSFDLGILEELRVEQMENMSVKGRSKTEYILLIFDDIAMDLNKYQKKEMVRLFTRDRHLNFCVICTSQSIRGSLPPACRNQATNIILIPHKIKPKDMEAIEENIYIDDKYIETIIEDVKSDKPYSFLFIDLTTQKPLLVKNYTHVYPQPPKLEGNKK